MALILNEIEVRKMLNSAAINKSNFFYNAAKLRFNVAKTEMLQDFDENEITKELSEDNVSNTDSILVEDGSLRAAIGFNEKDTPAQDLRDYLQDNIKLDNKENVKVTQDRSKVYFNWKVFYPSKTQIFEDEKFQLPWTTKSWVSIIENGLNNLSHFIMAKTEKTAARFKDIGSRSGWGLMKNNANTGRSFTPQKYISLLIDNFKKKFE